MTQGRTIDRDFIHQKLWERTDRRGCVKFDLQVLAKELDAGYSNLSVIINEMVDAGRLRVVSGGHFKRKLYRVANPQEFQDHPTG